MKIGNIFGTFTLLCIALPLLPMEVGRESRALLIENTTDDTVKILTNIDEGTELETLITPKEKAVFRFNQSIDGFAVQGVGMFAGWNKQDYTQVVSNIAKKTPLEDVSVKIQTPEEKEGLFDTIASYFKPYVVQVESVEKIEWDLLLIPTSGRLLDLFPVVKQSFEKSPSESLVVTDFFAVSADVSPEVLTQKFQHLLSMWKELAANSSNPSHRAFANKVVKILEKAYLIGQMTPEAVGEAAMKVTGFVPKDPEQRKALGQASGEILQRLSAARAQKELRNLLKETK